MLLKSVCARERKCLAGYRAQGAGVGEHLELDGEALQVALEKVLAGGVHHLGPDLGRVRRPGAPTPGGARAPGCRVQGSGEGGDMQIGAEVRAEVG